jgi:hypothetical protein
MALPALTLTLTPPMLPRAVFRSVLRLVQSVQATGAAEAPPIARQAVAATKLRARKVRVFIPDSFEVDDMGLSSN